ncbi:hypothetical protein ACQJBY_010069 [Aegilops geniculata]
MGGATVWSPITGDCVVRQARVAGRVVNRGSSPWKRRAGATSSKELQLGGGEDAWWDYPFTSGCTFPHLRNKRRSNPAEEFGEEEEQVEQRRGRRWR